MRERTSIIAIAAALAITSTSQASNLLVNGSFENGNFVPVPGGLDDYMRVFTGGTAISGWTVSAGSVDWHKDLYLFPAQSGRFMVDLNGETPGTLRQSFATTVGQEYELKFWLGGPGTFLNASRTVLVSAGNRSNVQFSQPTSSEFNIQWGQKSMRFVATSALTTLSVSSANPTGFWGPTVDNFSVQLVPEPSTVVAVSFGLLAFARKRRTRQQA